MQIVNITWKTTALSAALLGLASATTDTDAQAVTLQQRWIKGQQLTYNLALNGALNMQAPAGAPIPGAGTRPISIGLDLSCQTTVDTVDVDDKGTGTLAMRTGNVAFKAAAMGGQFVLRDGRGYTTVGGKSIAPPRDIDLAQLQNPREAWRISKQGRFQGIVPLPAVTGGVTDASPPEGAAPTTSVAPAVSALLQNRIMQALPALWPQGEVKTGDKWTAEVKWPLDDKASTQPGTGANATGSNNGAESSNNAGDAATTPGLGKFNLALVGEEEVSGHTLQRITIDGTIEIDESKAAALTTLATAPSSSTAPSSATAPTSPTAPSAKTPPGRMLGTRQKVSGEMWLDAQAQQLTRLDLDLASQTALLSNAVGNTGRPGTWWFDFAGKLRMQLNRVLPADAGGNVNAAGPSDTPAAP
ncbi:MAG TPA: hypothetical protein VF600_16275 [Abditibacteriaceae bacterium]|jgi:hypothetical protein